MGRDGVVVVVLLTDKGGVVVMLVGEVVLREIEVVLKTGIVSGEVPLKGKSTVEGLETVEFATEISVIPILGTGVDAPGTTSSAVRFVIPLAKPVAAGMSADIDALSATALVVASATPLLIVLPIPKLLACP